MKTIWTDKKGCSIQSKRAVPFLHSGDGVSREVFIDHEKIFLALPLGGKEEFEKQNLPIRLFYLAQGREIPLSIPKWNPNNSFSIPLDLKESQGIVGFQKGEDLLFLPYFQGSWEEVLLYLAQQIPGFHSFTHLSSSQKEEWQLRRKEEDLDKIPLDETLGWLGPENAPIWILGKYGFYLKNIYFTYSQILQVQTAPTGYFEILGPYGKSFKFSLPQPLKDELLQFFQILLSLPLPRAPLKRLMEREKVLPKAPTILEKQIYHWKLVLGSSAAIFCLLGFSSLYTNSAFIHFHENHFFLLLYYITLLFFFISPFSSKGSKRQHGFSLSPSSGQGTYVFDSLLPEIIPLREGKCFSSALYRNLEENERLCFEGLQKAPRHNWMIWFFLLSFSFFLFSFLLFLPFGLGLFICTLGILWAVYFYRSLEKILHEKKVFLHLWNLKRKYGITLLLKTLLKWGILEEKGWILKVFLQKVYGRQKRQESGFDSRQKILNLQRKLAGILLAPPEIISQRIASFLGETISTASLDMGNMPFPFLLEKEEQTSVSLIEQLPQSLEKFIKSPYPLFPKTLSNHKPSIEEKIAYLFHYSPEVAMTGE